MSIHEDVPDDSGEDLEALGLTEAELEAIKPEEIKDEQDNEDGSSDPATDTTDSAEEDGNSPSTDNRETAGEEAVKDEEKEEPTDSITQEEATFAPTFEAESTEGAEVKLDDLEKGYTTASDELAARYEAGSITFSEYRKEDRTIQAEYDTLKQELTTAQLKEDIAAEHSKQSAEQKWELEQNIFYQDNDVYKTDPIMRGALGAQLEALYKDDTNKGKSGLWFLREAGKTIDERLGRAAPAKSDADLKAAQDAQRKKAAKELDVPSATLAEVPAAGTNSDEGEFAYMDKLEGLAYEKALVSMSEDKYTRFMAD